MTKCNTWYAFYILDILLSIVYYNRCKEEVNLLDIILKERGKQNDKICNFKENR
nr:MAG TPA: hypothetical protein [Caudoviricetes sp.]